MAVEQKLTLSVVSKNEENNTSSVRILWTSTQTGLSYNNYTRTAYYWVKLPDGTETKYSVSYTLPGNATCTILDKTITVTHKADGSGTVSVRTWMDTDISAGVIELGPVYEDLETFAQEAHILFAADVTLGNACGITFNPHNSSHYFQLLFSIGDWSSDYIKIYPNTAGTYTYSGYNIPISVAKQIKNAKTGKMNVELIPFHKLSGGGQGTPEGMAIGSDSSTFTVTVPNNSETQPSVSMTLTPVSSLPEAFNGLYIQGKTKVRATLEAAGKYDATIKSYSMEAEGVTYDAGDEYTSGYIAGYGNIKISGYAKDSRGYTGSTTQTIAVIGYSKPRLLAVSGESDVIAARCDAEGNLSDGGTCLIIKAKRSYNKVSPDGVQRNFCKIQYRYKAVGGSYSSWAAILAADSLDSDEIVTGALLNGALSEQSSYLVQVRAIDDIGEKTTTTITIPTDKVYMHRNGARRSITFGGYVEEDDTFLIAGGITFKTKGPIQAQGGGNIDTLVLGVKLTATADAPITLNDYKTPGNYYSPNAENSQYIQDSPYAEGGFGMTVRELQSTGYIRQELFYARTTWERHWDGTEWSGWWHYLTTTIAEEAAVDYVTENGTGGGWTYRKWKSGRYEMFGTFSLTPSESTQNDTLYRTNNMTIDVPFQISSAYVSGTAVGHYWITNGGISGSSAITLRLMSDKNMSTTNAIEVRLTVVGTYT